MRALKLLAVVSEGSAEVGAPPLGPGSCDLAALRLGTHSSGGGESP